MKKYLPYLLTGVIVFLLILLLKDCRVTPSYRTPSSDTIKQTIYRDILKRDTVLIEVKVKEEARTKIITRFKEVRHDSLIPCEEKLVICDTVIRVDSALIYSLKEVIKLDSSIIGNYQKSSQIDSLTIVGLKKEVKKQKRQKRLLAALSVVLGGLVIVK